MFCRLQHLVPIRSVRCYAARLHRDMEKRVALQEAGEQSILGSYSTSRCSRDDLQVADAYPGRRIVVIESIGVTNSPQ